MDMDNQGMKTPEEWAEELREQLHSLDNAPASMNAKKKTIKESQTLAFKSLRAHMAPGAERRECIRAYSRAIKQVAIEDLQRMFTLRREKMCQDAEIKREQQEKKWADDNARRLSRMKEKRSDTPPLTGGAIAILLLLVVPLSLYGLWGFGSVFWHGLNTGELIFRSGCRPQVISCLSHIMQTNEPFNFYIGMAVFLFATLLCAVMLLGAAMALSEAGKTPEDKR
jgi:hypothetical protein